MRRGVNWGLVDETHPHPAHLGSASTHDLCAGAVVAVGASGPAVHKKPPRRKASRRGPCRKMIVDAAVSVLACEAKGKP